MASTSSSSIMVTPDSIASSYDVFLSFRGPDTRDAFTDHLYEALVRTNIRTFRDNDEISRGEKLMPEIKRAIKESTASIVILSENYAASPWCLEELRLILKQRQKCGHLVLPVFYRVNPSDIRKQSETLSIDVETSLRWTDYHTSQWKLALTEVADLAGKVLYGAETKFLKEIVDIIYNKLDCKKVHLPPNLTGMDTRYEQTSSWLEESSLQFLVIWGMGGSGKTTLAKYIYNLNWRTFESMSIIEDVGTRCKKEPEDMLQLQEKLLRDILGGKKTKISSVCQGTFKINEALETKKALIVLDDIVEPTQLEALLGMGKINIESKIVITTRNAEICKWFESRYWRFHEYEMKLLDADESLELLSLSVFRSKTLLKGYEELAQQVVQYCEGNPLALKVSSSLLKDNSIPSWESALKLLGKELHHDIYSVLRRSYDLLPFDLDRELFLDIAFYFVNEVMDCAVKILEFDYSALSGIESLAKRCLLTVSPNRYIKMHRLHQDMALNIVRQESRIPGKRSRVCRNKESYDVLRSGKGSKTVEGLALDMEMLEKEVVIPEPPRLTTDSFKRMDKLRILKLKFVKLTGSYENFSEDLRWLSWHGFHLPTLPSDLFMGNLVSLNLSNSLLEVFEPPMVLRALKFLNLGDSKNLMTIRKLSRLPNVVEILLQNCSSLVTLDKSMEYLTSLCVLDLNGSTTLFPWKCSWLATARAKLLGHHEILKFPGRRLKHFFDLPHSLLQTEILTMFINNNQEQVYMMMAEMHKTSFAQKVVFTFRIPGKRTKSATISEAGDANIKAHGMDIETLKESVINDTMECTSPSLTEKMAFGSFDVYLRFAISEDWHFGVDLNAALVKAGLHISPYFDRLPGSICLLTADVKASIIILSESFISSVWDLNKLMLVLEQKRNTDHFVLPVFYNLKSTDIQKRGRDLLFQKFRGSGESMRKVDQWHATLMEIANLPGINYSEKDDATTVINEIVHTVLHVLYPDPCSTATSKWKENSSVIGRPVAIRNSKCAGCMFGS